MRKLLKAMSIILIVFGAIELIVTGLAGIGVGFGSIFDFAEVFGASMIIGLIVEGVMAILSIVCGILGCLDNKHIMLYKKSFIIGIVLGVFCIANIALNIFVFGGLTIPFIIRSVINIAVICLYLVALRKSNI